MDMDGVVDVNINDVAGINPWDRMDNEEQRIFRKWPRNFNPMSKGLKNWSTKELCKWIYTFDCERFMHDAFYFYDQGITGKDVYNMKEDDFAREFGKKADGRDLFKQLQGFKVKTKNIQDLVLMEEQNEPEIIFMGEENKGEDDIHVNSVVGATDKEREVEQVDVPLFKDIEMSPIWKRLRLRGLKDTFHDSGRLTLIGKPSVVAKAEAYVEERVKQRIGIKPTRSFAEVVKVLNLVDPNIDSIVLVNDTINTISCSAEGSHEVMQELAVTFDRIYRIYIQRPPRWKEMGDECQEFWQKITELYGAIYETCIQCISKTKEMGAGWQMMNSTFVRCLHDLKIIEDEDEGTLDYLYRKTAEAIKCVSAPKEELCNFLAHQSANVKKLAADFRNLSVLNKFTLVDDMRKVKELSDSKRCLETLETEIRNKLEEVHLQMTRFLVEKKKRLLLLERESQQYETLEEQKYEHSETVLRNKRRATAQRVQRLEKDLKHLQNTKYEVANLIMINNKMILNNDDMKENVITHSVFIVDESGSISNTQFEVMRKFIVKTIECLEKSDSSSLFSIILFACSVRIVIKQRSGLEALRVIRTLKRNSGLTNTAQALRDARGVLWDCKKNLDLCRQYVFTCTDGQSNNPVETIAAGKALKREFPDMRHMTIGIGNIGATAINELNQISYWDGKSASLKVETFQDLLDEVYPEIEKRFAEITVEKEAQASKAMNVSVEKKLKFLNIPLFSSQVTKYATPEGKARLINHNKELKTQICLIDEQIKAKEKEQSQWLKEQGEELAKEKPDDEMRKKIREHYCELAGQINGIQEEIRRISQNLKNIKNYFGYFEKDYEELTSNSFAEIHEDVNKIFDELTDIDISNVEGWNTINQHCGSLARNLRRLSRLKEKVQMGLKMLSLDDDKFRRVTGLPKWKLLRLATDYEDVTKIIGTLNVSLSSMNTKLEHSLQNIAHAAPDKGLKISQTKAIKMHKEFLSQMVVVFKILPVIFKHRVEISRSILGNVGRSSQSGQDDRKYLALSNV